MNDPERPETVFSEPALNGDEESSLHFAAASTFQGTRMKVRYLQRPAPNSAESRATETFSFDMSETSSQLNTLMFSDASLTPVEEAFDADVPRGELRRFLQRRSHAYQGFTVLRTLRDHNVITGLAEAVNKAYTAFQGADYEAVDRLVGDTTPRFATRNKRALNATRKDVSMRLKAVSSLLDRLGVIAHKHQVNVYDDIDALEERGGSRQHQTLIEDARYAAHTLRNIGDRSYRVAETLNRHGNRVAARVPSHDAFSIGEVNEQLRERLRVSD